MNAIEQIEELRKKQLSFFSSGKTRDIKFRKESLRKLRDVIIKRDKEIGEALRKDLNKSSFEAYATETGIVLHIANKNLPFGGVGDSGIGRYHGKESFRAFSNMKAVKKTSSLIDIPIKYPPFKKKERILRLFLK